jgi:hypothetical protein
MALLNFDSSQVAPDTGVGDPIPAGWYNVMMDESDVKPTKAEGGMYLECRFNIIDGQFAGRKLFARFNIRNANPMAQEIGYKQLSAVCHAVGMVGMVADSQMLHGKPLKVKVKVRKADGDYEASNDITAYKNINEPTGTTAGAPAAMGMPALHQTAAAAATAVPAGFPAQPWAAGGAASTAAPAQPMGAPAGFPGFPGAATAVAATPAQPPAAQPVAAQPAAVNNAPVVNAPPPTPPAPTPPAQITLPPVKQMTAKANGLPYDDFIKQGWTDALLLEHGYMEMVNPTPPATPAAVTLPTAPATPAVPAAAATPVGPVPGAATLVPPWMQKPAG